MGTVPPIRTMLFVPGNREGWVEKAAATGADAVVIDLEGAVPSAEKDHARALTAEAVHAFAGRDRPRLFVRTTAAASGTMEADLDAVVHPGLAGILLPQVEGVDDVVALSDALDDLESSRDIPAGSVVVDPLLETPSSLREAYALATASPRIAYMGAGVSERGDIARRMGYRWTRDGLETLFFRSKVLLDVRAAEVPNPLTGIWGEIDDLDGLRGFAEQSRAIGYDGMMVIHPSHVEIVNQVFTPTEQELAYWRELLEVMEAAYREGRGAVRFRGELIDEAHVWTARQHLGLGESD